MYLNSMAWLILWQWITIMITIKLDQLPQHSVLSCNLRKQTALWTPWNPAYSHNWISSAGPCSYYIQAGNRQIRQNRGQVQLAFPQSSSTITPHLESTLTFPDKLRPNFLTATPQSPHHQLRSAQNPPPMLSTPSMNTTFSAPDATPAAPHPSPGPVVQPPAPDPHQPALPRHLVLLPPYPQLLCQPLFQLCSIQFTHKTNYYTKLLGNPTSCSLF